MGRRVESKRRAVTVTLGEGHIKRLRQLAQYNDGNLSMVVRSLIDRAEVPTAPRPIRFDGGTQEQTQIG